MLFPFFLDFASERMSHTCVFVCLLCAEHGALNGLRFGVSMASFSSECLGNVIANEFPLNYGCVCVIEFPPNAPKYRPLLFCYSRVAFIAEVSTEKLQCCSFCRFD